MILLSDQIKATKWTPTMENNEWINSERTWILIHNNKCRIAICSVYMACELRVMILKNGMIKFMLELVKK